MSTTTLTDPADYNRVDAYQEFFRRYYEEDLHELAQHYPGDTQSIQVAYEDLFRFNPPNADGVPTDLAHAFEEQPEHEHQYMQEAIRTYDLPVDMSLSDVQVRVQPPENGTLTRSITGVRTRDTECYRSIKAQVTKRTKNKSLLKEGAFECQRCGTLTRVPQFDTSFQEPHECQGCERQGPFRLNTKESEFVDYQKLRLQQLPEEAHGQGQEMMAHIEGDIVESVESGDRVEFAGILRLQQETQNNSKEPTFDTYLEGRQPRKIDSDYSDIDVDEHLDEIRAIARGEHGDPYELLVESVAPKIMGYSEIKLAIILQLFGGVRAEYPDGSADRGDSHILLLGDPGTAKSSLLRKVQKIAPNSTIASGKGATAAGMTATAVQDSFGGGEWSLEAGAIVRANNGVALIDEIDKVDESAVSSLHGALENQVVEVQKAGIDASLPAKTTVLAAGNPKYGRFEEYQPIGEQLEMSPTLLSRFDLIFLLRDQPHKNREEDEFITEHMIEANQSAVKHTRDPEATSAEKVEDIEPAIGEEVVRAYIAYAKENVFPIIEDDEVAQNLKESFLAFRQANSTPDDKDAAVPVTRRKLQAILRLAQASARVRLSDTVEKQDIDRARELVGRCLRDVGIDPESGEFDVDLVEAGTSKSQRDRITKIFELIGELEDEYDGGAPHGELANRAGTQGISNDKMEYEIQKLMDKGEVYEPNQGHYRTT